MLVKPWNIVEENQQSKTNNLTINKDDIFINNNFDFFFGHSNLRKHVQDLHKKENLQFFNEMIWTDESDIDLESLSCFFNLDLLGTNRLDGDIEKKSRDKKGYITITLK